MHPLAGVHTNYVMQLYTSFGSWVASFITMTRKLGEVWDTTFHQQTNRPLIQVYTSNFITWEYYYAYQKFRGPIFSILCRLFLPNLTEVPHMKPSVGTAGRQDCLVMGRPLNLKQGQTSRLRMRRDYFTTRD